MTRLHHAHRVRRSAAALLALAVACGGSDVGRVQPFESSGRALTQSFAAGSLIIPMDTTYQDNGTLKAFGLVNEVKRHVERRAHGCSVRGMTSCVCR